MRSTNVRDTADFDVDRALVSTSSPTGSCVRAVAPRRDAGEHPLQHDPARADHGQRNADRSRAGTSVSPSAVRTRGRSTSTRRPPSVTSPSSWPWRTAVRSGFVLALRADDIVDLLLHQLAQHAEPDTDAEREQPLLRCPNELRPTPPARAPGARPHHGSPAATGTLLSRRFLLRSLADRRARSQPERTRPEGPPSLKVLRAPGQPPRRTAQSRSVHQRTMGPDSRAISRSGLVCPSRHVAAPSGATHWDRRARWSSHRARADRTRQSRRHRVR